ncbi:lipopolysaccharide biosynthesis protein [Methylobacterium planeticum]|uniref:Uncharacterized protein n=1 Tax=Methylobacterium planeticum TaxID=2615211 RepID=A0A6N6MQL1_9HYPH|nr:hypothetical protein [Methylobacterium planeticum]KAB1070763.1 hypothetical protein F6X51_21565 [Methylobacterium planeticum]
MISRSTATVLVGRRELFRAQRIELLAAPVILLAGATFVLIANAALLLNAQVDAVIVGMIGLPQDVAHDRIGTAGAILLTCALHVFPNVTSPPIARLSRERAFGRPRQLCRTVQPVTTNSLAITICFAAAGRRLLALLSGDADGQARPILVIVSTGYWVSAASGPIGTLLSMTGHREAPSRLTGTTAIAPIGAASARGPSGGVTGGIVATALSVAGDHLLMRVYARPSVEL